MWQYLYVESIIYMSHSDCSSRYRSSAALASFMTVRLNLSAMEFCSGWFGTVFVCVVPCVLRNVFIRFSRNSLALSK